MGDMGNPESHNENFFEERELNFRDKLIKRPNL